MAAFDPLINGLPYANDWPSRPILRLEIPLWGEVDVGDASLGLCGGMTFSALDYFLAGRLPPCSADEDYLIRRQIDSIGGVAGALLVWAWTAESDDRVSRHSQDQWAVLHAGLAAGPVPLMLIRAHGIDPREEAHNHQVLACAMDVAVVTVYDCNRPGQSRRLVWGETGFSLDGESIRGFYVNRAYHCVRPPGQPI